MEFKEQLKIYIKKLNCTAKELSIATNLSAAVISRYKNGLRVPNLNSDTIQKLATGIKSIATEKGIQLGSLDEIESSFVDTLSNNNIDYEIFSEKFSMILSTMNINISSIAKYLNFDPSYISRIRTAQRHPADVKLFSENVGHYLFNTYRRDSDKLQLSNVIQKSVIDITKEEDFVKIISKWMCSNQVNHSHRIDYNNIISEFVTLIDEFNLDEFTQAYKLMSSHIHSESSQLPMTKSYYTNKSTEQFTSDLFKYMLSNTINEPVYFYADSSLSSYFHNKEYLQLFISCFALLLIRNVQINIIHNINLPIENILEGMRTWIPFYLTGQIKSYYIDNISPGIFNHFEFYSRDISFIGETSTSKDDVAHFYITRMRNELNFYKKRMNVIFNEALPLMEIYKENRYDEFFDFMLQNSKEKGTRHEILPTLPIHTISDNLLERILERHSIKLEDREKIIKTTKICKECALNSCKHSYLIDEFPILSKDEFEANPPALSLSKAFYEDTITYSYLEYLEHLELTRRFADKVPNYIIKSNDTTRQQSILISRQGGKWVLVSKSKFPAIHFLFTHPQLRNAFEQYMSDLNNNLITKK
ncbi:helix-turn-helix domain-containing protein [Lachnobacterium bovis]|uniref:helix-turn-helix domain-containing protein n=1 Tax=Lachnobacterium bovis TaxID=140626 RepID=UPI00048651DB|nr:helix-turn-helix transcriptional regulator [Lachnobacterium bovis]